MAIYISKDASDALAHYGVLGMKWGVRRYRNKDGSLTNAGKKRYGINEKGWMSKEGKERLRSDRAKQDKAFSKKVARLPSNLRTAAVEGYLKENNTQEWKNLIAQERIEFAFDDLRKVAEHLTSNGAHEIEVAVNKVGQFELRAKDPQFRKLKTTGYETVNSIEDVMKIVTISDDTWKLESIYPH